MTGTYNRNLETGKLEIHFEKEDYMALPDELKKEIKSAFLFSRRTGAWVSRAKFPNLWRAEAVAQKLGLVNEGKIGESLSFAEQMEKKAERAEARAERYDYKSESAERRAEQLQKPINDMHGDIAFFTQPNINSSGGRAFTNRRNRMFAAYEKGFEEFKKSGYYAERAKIARETAAGTKPASKAFCVRRIEEAEKIIRAQNKNLENYKKHLEMLENNEEPNQKAIDKINRYIEDTEEILEQAISKSIYYHECLEDLGGVKFSKKDIKPGYIVNVEHWGPCEVISTGPKNFTYNTIGDRSGICLKGSYAEILKVIKAEEKGIEHSFKVGDVFIIEKWDSELRKNIPIECTITKVTPQKATVKPEGMRARAITVRSLRDNVYAIDVFDNRNGWIYKKKEENPA